MIGSGEIKNASQQVSLSRLIVLPILKSARQIERDLVAIDVAEPRQELLIRLQRRPGKREKAELRAEAKAELRVPLVEEVVIVDPLLAGCVARRVVVGDGLADGAGDLEFVGVRVVRLRWSSGCRPKWRSRSFVRRFDPGSATVG
jgi:hypothetical protein